MNYCSKILYLHQLKLSFNSLLRQKNIANKCVAFKHDSVFHPILSRSFQKSPLTISNQKFSSDTKDHATFENLLRDNVLKLEKIDRDLYRASDFWKPVGINAVYGGQIMGQAMVAGNETRPEGCSIHSIHTYFLRPGKPDLPILYHVDRTLDGKAFSNRSVKAVQDGKTILTLQLSYHKPEATVIEHQGVIPTGLPNPLDVATLEDKFEEYLRYDKLTKIQRTYLEQRLTEKVPVEIRPLDPEGFFRIAGKERDPEMMYWVKARGNIGDDNDLHRCVAAYMSDNTLIVTALSGMQGFKPFMVASLDHAMWFHSPFRADEFMLYDIFSTRAVGGRSLIHGKIWKQDGTLAMSVVQEGLIRGRAREIWKPDLSGFKSQM